MHRLYIFIVIVFSTLLNIPRIEILKTIENSGKTLAIEEKRNKCVGITLLLAIQALPCHSVTILHIASCIISHYKFTV